MDVATPVSGESISEYVSRAEGVDSRFSRYNSQVLSEETQNVLRDIFGENAVTSKSYGVTGLRRDQSQTDILLESRRSSQPDRLTSYKELYKSSLPLHEKSEEFLKVPSLGDIEESFLINRFSSKACFRRAIALHTTQLREIEKLGYQGHIAAKAIVLYMQQALRVL